jgi:hypothetical protein
MIMSSNIGLYAIATIFSFLLIFIIKEKRKFLLIVSIWFLLLGFITINTEQGKSYDGLSTLLFTIASISYPIRHLINNRER